MHSQTTRLKTIAALKVGLLTAHEWPCADCGAELWLIMIENHPVYQCGNLYLTGCKGVASAHADGTPLGIPIDEDGRTLRKLLHGLIDPYWKNERDKKKARLQVYEFMHAMLGDITVIKPDGSEMLIQAFHVAYLLHEDLRRAIAIAKEDLPTFRFE